MGVKLCSAANTAVSQKQHELHSTGLTQDMLSLPKFKQVSSGGDTCKPQYIPEKQNLVISVVNQRSRQFLPSKTPIYQSLEKSEVMKQSFKGSNIFNQIQLELLQKIINRESEILEQRFALAKNEQIFWMVNQKIPKVQEPLAMDPNLVSHMYEQRPEAYTIKNDMLPEPGDNLPEWWIYIGQWSSHLPHGIGKIYHRDFVYEGYLHRGVPHIFGRFVTPDQIYQGEITFNMRSGFGRLVTLSGSFHEGQWKNNMRQGKGFEIHKDGIVFEGLYKNNRISSGTLLMPKKHIRKFVGKVQNQEYLNMCKENWKEKYQGDLVDNKFQGNGHYYWSDRRQYQGQWRYGQMNGYGKFTWPNGKVYVGSYCNNKKEGYGVFEGNGKTYDGRWFRGKPHGKGKLIKGNKVVENNWHQGKIIDKNLKSDSISMLSECEEMIPEQSVVNLNFED